ncbi:hypothetical protein [Paraburkholderia ribeironis]|uniref:hypothetical protein n=1 Tax=Paraburkholderia ribeironis TaxID=1247936 RepID=UPI0011777E47|nr:hypothetical protein [Paraburkholderia ribeironis]
MSLRNHQCRAQPTLRRTLFSRSISTILGAGTVYRRRCAHGRLSGEHLRGIDRERGFTCV